MPRAPGSAAFHPCLAEMLPAHKPPLPPQPLTPCCCSQLGCSPALWCPHCQPGTPPASRAGASSLRHITHRLSHLWVQPGRGKWEVEAGHTVYLLFTVLRMYKPKTKPLKGKPPSGRGGCLLHSPLRRALPAPAVATCHGSPPEEPRGAQVFEAQG